MASSTSSRRVDVPERMGPDGDPAGLVDERDRLGHGRRGAAAGRPGRRGSDRPRAVARRSRSPRARGASCWRDDRRRPARDGDGRSRRASGNVELEPAGAQRVGHAPGRGRPDRHGARPAPRAGAGSGGRAGSRGRAGPPGRRRARRARSPGPRGGREPRPPASASSTPSTVSWSVSASSSHARVGARPRPRRPALARRPSTSNGTAGRTSARPRASTLATPVCLGC